MAINRKIMAYRRQNGKVGVRNHVIILPVDDISNACVEKVAAMVPVDDITLEASGPNPPVSPQTSKRTGASPPPRNQVPRSVITQSSSAMNESA